jgi:hypothetical protein
MSKQRTFKPPQSITAVFPQVKQVIHARKAVNVTVSSEDCEVGKKASTSECALAKATKRQFHADGVAIRLTDSFIIKGSTAIRFKTPETVKREIVSFDRHKDFASGTYRLSAAPPDWAKPSRRQGSNKPAKVKSGKTNKIVHRTARVRTTNSLMREEK